MTRTLQPVAQKGVGTRIAHDPGDPLITSHCPFCGSGQVVGRSDGTIGCDFCGSAYIVRVQPAFPGMPQMPNGPGAPSDVGPDGGLMDPGAIGPDGMPMDGGPVPGEEDEGAPPFGDDEGGAPDGEAGPPPPGGGKDDSGSKPPPKGKSDKKPKSKKESAYRGFDGQALTEDQYVRHLAATLSGCHPAVMASLRADAKSRKTAGAGMTDRAGEWAGFMSGLQNTRRHRLTDYPHDVFMGQHQETGKWYMSIHPHAPENAHMTHVVPLGRVDQGPEFHAATALMHPAAQEFMRSTMPGRQALGRRRPFAREAIYNGWHEEIHSVSDLRRHMSDVHGLADAGRLLRPHLLSYMHHQDHAQDYDPHSGNSDMQMSLDASHSPGFIARRVTAHEDSLPGDEEFAAHLRDRHPDIAELSMFFPAHVLRSAHDESHFHDPEDTGIGPDASRGPGLLASLPGGTR